MKKFSTEEIKTIIPHRYEMLIVDEVEIIGERKAVGRIFLTEDKWFFKGHFPGNPVMPGVLQVEAAAQVGAVAMLSIDGNEGKTGYFGGIDKVKFRKMVLPGDVLSIEVELLRIKLGMGKCEAKGYDQDGNFVFSAQFTFTVM